MKITAVDTFQMQWDRPGSRSAFVQIRTDGDVNGIGEASPMQGGMASLGIIARDIAPVLIGTDPLDHGAVLDQVRHQLIKLGPDGALAGALAAVDIALWDLKGKLLGLPIHRILGGARRSRLPFYASIGGNAGRTVEGVLDVVKTRLDDEHPQLVKIRWDGDRTKLDADIPGDIAKAKAVRAMVGDDFPLAFDANNGYSVGGAIRVGRALEDLGFLWFEEPVQHYHVKATGEVAQRLDITVSAGEQTYTLQGVADLIDAGVRMVQPNIVKMGGISGLMECAALCTAYGVELVPHQTQPTIGHTANLHVLASLLHCTKPAELADNWRRAGVAFLNPPMPENGHFVIPTGPGLGLQLDPVQLDQRRIPIS